MSRYKLRPFTEEEKKLAEENHNSIYAFLYTYKYSIENFYGIAAMGFLKGIQVYCRKNRFTQKADLFFTCWQYMRAEVENHLKMESRQKRKPIETVISLDAEYSEMESLLNLVIGKSLESHWKTNTWKKCD